MTDLQPQARLMVLMFTDLVNSTGLKRELGVDAYAPLLVRHDAIFRRVISRVAGAQVHQDTGDGYFASFATVSDAVRAALAFQWRMRAEAWPHPLCTRVGIHMGEVVRVDVGEHGETKLVASAIDLASRIMSLAVGGQVLVTRVVFDEARQSLKEHPPVDGVDAADAPPPPPLRWVAHGPYLFKGAGEPIDVFEVGPEGLAPLAAPPDSEKAKRHIRPGDDQTLGWRPAVGLAMPDAPHWVIARKLGEGGFGEVWLAEHAKTHGQRVFKFCFDPDRLRALKREVVLFRLLKEALGDRPDIARVIDWQFDRAPYYIEMDYTPHGNLVDWSAALGPTNGQAGGGQADPAPARPAGGDPGPARQAGTRPGVGNLPLASRIRLVAQVAEALAAAHSVGILHKDIKPSNILITRPAGGGEPRPRLTDFGIGMLTDRGRLKEFNITPGGFTASNLSMSESSRTGTRMYAPPESLLDKPHTIQGDVYALGVLLYQMAVADLNRPLGVGWEREVDDPLLREDIQKCVEVDPARRFESAGEVAVHLNTLEQRRDKRRAAERARRRRLRFRAAMTLALCVGVPTAAYWGGKLMDARQNEKVLKDKADKLKARTDELEKKEAELENKIRALGGKPD